jgi:hypothetical protein
MLSALVSLVTGYLQAKAVAKVGGKLADYVDDYFRLLASILISSYVTFLAVWGGGALALWQSAGIWVALGVGFAMALVATGLVVFNLWNRSPLTKGIAVAVPSDIVGEAVNQNITITERK